MVEIEWAGFGSLGLEGIRERRRCGATADSGFMPIGL